MPLAQYFLASSVMTMAACGILSYPVPIQAHLHTHATPFHFSFPSISSCYPVLLSSVSPFYPFLVLPIPFSIHPHVSLPFVLFLFHPFLPFLFLNSLFSSPQPPFLSIKTSWSLFRNVPMIHFHLITDIQQTQPGTLPNTLTLLSSQSLYIFNNFRIQFMCSCCSSVSHPPEDYRFYCTGWTVVKPS